MLCLIPDNENILIYENNIIRIRTSFRSKKEARFGDIRMNNLRATRDREIVELLEGNDKGNNLAIISLNKNSVYIVKIQSIQLLESKDKLSRFHRIEFEITSQHYSLSKNLAFSNRIFNVQSIKEIITGNDYLRYRKYKQTKTTEPIGNKNASNKRIIKGSLSRYGNMRRENQEAAFLREEQWLDKLRNKKLPIRETYSTTRLTNTPQKPKSNENPNLSND